MPSTPPTRPLPPGHHEEAPSFHLGPLRNKPTWTTLRQLWWQDNEDMEYLQ